MKTSDKSVRVLNFIIDTIVILTIMFLISYGTYFIYPEILDDNSIVFDIFYFTIFFSYYFFFEALTGRTVGKIVTKTIVVNRDGNKPNSISVIIRTLFRLIPFDGFTYLFGSRGLHDLVSKTTVTGLQNKFKSSQ